MSRASVRHSAGFAVLISLLLSIVTVGFYVGFQVSTASSEKLALQTGVPSWETSPEIRVIMSSTADWARLMFDDLFGTNTNGVRISRILGAGWLSGNKTNYRIDVGNDLTYIDVLYNATVQRTGDIVGFFKGNNEFTFARMYADVILDVDKSQKNAYVYLMLAGAGTTTFQLVNKQTNKVLWQDTVSGNSFTQYIRRFISSDTFFQRERLEGTVVILLGLGTFAMVALLNAAPKSPQQQSQRRDEWDGL